MKYLFLLATLFASFTLAKSSTLNTPQDVIVQYQKAMNNGDISALQKVMVADSFNENMHVYSLSIAMQDKAFKKVRKAYDTSDKARKEVIAKVAKKLKDRKARNNTNLTTSSLGKGRAMVRYLEDNRKKQLYLSLEKDGWKVNYLAGRKTK